MTAPVRTPDSYDRGLDARARHAIGRAAAYRVPGWRDMTDAQREVVARTWAAHQSDADLLKLRNVGHVTLRHIRALENDPTQPPIVVRRMLQRCPVCTETAVARLALDWQQQVAAGGAIPIVGCGNPWHYDGMTDPSAGTCQVCGEAIHDADCPRVGDGRPSEGDTA